MKKKTFYIIPGFGESPRDGGYRKIRRMAESKGYKVIQIEPRWTRRTISHWLDAARTQIPKHNTKNDVLLGFSFGAMVAVLLAQEFHFKKLILCSLSPYFREDLRHIPRSAQLWVGKRRLEDFKRHPFPKQSKTREAVFLIGGTDWSFAIKRVRERYGRWNGQKTMKIIPEIGHDISHPDYIKALKKYL